MFRLRDMIARLRTSALVRNSGWAFAGLGGNFALQAGCFVFMARLLGVTEYGIFAGAFALVSSVTPYSSLGFHIVFMRYVSADSKLAPTYWGNTLFVTAVSSALLVAGLAFAGGRLLGPGTVWLIVILAIANCFMSQIASSASTVFQTFEQLRTMAWLRALINLFRLIAVFSLLLYARHASALQCALALLVASCLAAAVSVVWVRKNVGKASLDLRLIRTRVWEGIGFSIAGSTQAVYNDVDKILLSHYGMNAANGIYSLAYRVADFATTPVNAIDTACLPRYFAISRQGLRAVARMSAKVVPIAAFSGLAAGGITLLASPLMVRIVGHGFAESLLVFRWLFWLPAFRGVHQLAGGVLTATGRQNYRTAAQILVALLNLGLNLIWIPAHGWLGAAWASLVSDGALMVLNLSLLFVLSARATGSEGTGSEMSA